MNTYVELTPEDIDTVEFEFYEVCRKIFELVDNERMKGVKCKRVEVHNNKIIAQTDWHLIRDPESLRTKECYNVKLIAKRDEDGVISKGSKITLDNEVEFIHKYKDYWKEELEQRIISNKQAFYEPVFTNTEPWNYDSFIRKLYGVKKYERLILTNEEKELIDSRLFGICHEMYDLADMVNKKHIIVRNDKDKDKSCLLNDNKIYLSKFITVDRVYFEGWFETHESGYSWFEVAERKRNGRIILSDDVNYLDKIKFIYNYENWGLKENYSYIAYDDINKQTTVSSKYVDTLRKILKK